MRADFTRYLGPGEDPTVNLAWGSVLAETLERAGVREVVVSPGSRSTPLVLAVARCPGLRVTVVLDERSAGFIGLGLARRSGAPVGLICTSGSAVAHYFPAVIEAWYSRAPLIVMTADRPPEMQDCGSGQTIDQVGIYGRYVHWSANVGLPEADAAAWHYLRETGLRAVREALGPRPGPVHLNLPFRDPLAPFASVGCNGILDTPFDLGAIVDGIEPIRRRRMETRLEAVRRLRERSGRGLIVMGAPYFGDEDRGLRGVAALSRILGYPVLADVVSSARGRADWFDSLVVSYERLLEVGLGPDLEPEVVVQIGGLPTSKRLRNWLAAMRDRLYYVQVDDGYGNHDPNRMDGGRLPIDPEGLADLAVPGGGLGSFAEAWVRAEAERSEGGLGAEAWCGETVCKVIAETVPEGSVVFFASSLAVRYAESGFGAVARGLTLTANRGANGIDGNVSTALGYAIAGETVFCLCGDLAFLHDVNALLSARAISGRLTILVIENGGGRIFDRLPVSRVGDVYETCFRTPQTVATADVAAGFGIPYVVVEDVAGLIGEMERQGEGRCRVMGLRGWGI